MQAPGKLILSGEHAVVHGKPALAMAVNRYARITARHRADGRWRCSLPEFDTELHFDLPELPSFVQRRLSNYDEFVDGKRPIDQVLERSLDVIPLAFCLGAGAGLNSLSGCSLTLQLEIPVGCGMGSSAAVSLAVAAAGARMVQRDYGLEELFDWSMSCERCMHGHPSGVDSYVCLHGGMVRFAADDRPAPRPASDWTLSLLDTGRPDCSTGECVVQVGREFPPDHSVWEEFAAVTEAIDQALLKRKADILPLVRENHRLLCRIGVVPKPLQQLVGAIEQNGGAAKICGAGAIKGSRGGVVLAVGDIDLQEICHKWSVNLIPCALNESGTTQIQTG